MSKYESLWKSIQKDGRDQFKLSFDEIKNILGFEIDHSFLTFKKELKNFGYIVEKISLKEKWICFSKIR